MISKPNEAEGQGWSIWAFVAIFVALAVVGLIAVLFVGSPNGNSKPAKTASSTVEPSTSSAEGAGRDTSTTTTTSTVPASPVTLPGGAAAPEGVSKVVAGDGVLSLGFHIDTSELGLSPLAMVPPLSASATDDGSALVVSIGCARTAREQLAQLSVTETDSSVTVSAVVLVPQNALGCNPSHRPRVVTVPLERSLAGRAITFVPTSTKLPMVNLEPDSGG